MKNEKLLKKEIAELLEAIKGSFSDIKWKPGELVYSLKWRDGFEKFVDEKVEDCSTEKLMEILEIIYNLGFENQSEITVKEIVTCSVNAAYSLFLMEGTMYYAKHLENFTFKEFYDNFHKGE